MKAIDVIKNSLTCQDYMVREHNSKISNGRCKSFRPEAKNPNSLMVNERDFYDFGNGKGGDVIELCALDKFDGNKGEAIKYLCEILNIENDYIAKSDADKLGEIFNNYFYMLDDAATFFHQSIKEEQRTYFHKRGITDQTIDELRLGWSDNPREYLLGLGYMLEDISEAGLFTWIDRYVFPYIRNGKCQYMISRASENGNFPECKYMKLKRNELSENPIWGIDSLKRAGTVIIAEGIMDAISCYQEGYPVVTAVTGQFSKAQKQELYSLLKNRDVIVCLDYDPITQAGQKFTKDLANELEDNGIFCKVVNLNNGESKLDINELYAENPCKETLEKVFENAKKWTICKLETIFEIQDKDKREKETLNYLRNLSFNFSFIELLEYLSICEETDLFAPEWLKEVKKIIKMPPSEREVVEKFKEKYNALYNPSLGWYIYENNVWIRTSEEYIGNKVIEILSKHLTSARLSAAKRILRDNLTSNIEFNTNEDMINFPNGMYSLSKNELLEHDKELYSTTQMDYNYNPNEDCPKWKKFLQEITDNNQDRIDLIQEMFGYAIDRSLQLQKCFYLNGEGANGKSVLLKILEKMVGKKNSTHIELAFMDSPFNRIHLMNSSINICMDMKTDVKGVESYFKAIVSGDPIDGCYKGKDIVNFIPKAKMFFAANEMLSMKTVDFSILRRIIFLNFPMKFCNNPTKENERQMDHELQGKLEKEVAGIFNWALEGYLRIKESKQFTETQDQQKMAYETKVLNNPIISFVEEWASKFETNLMDRKNKKEVYADYNKWCEENNYPPFRSNTFWRRLQEVFPYEITASNGNYFVKFLEPNKYKMN